MVDEDNVDEDLDSHIDLNEEGFLDVDFLGDSVHTHVMFILFSTIFPT